MKKLFLLFILGLSASASGVALHAETCVSSGNLEIYASQDQNNWVHITSRNGYYNNQGLWIDQNVDIYKDTTDGSIWIKTPFHGVGRVEKNPDYEGPLTFLKGGYRTNKKYRARCGNTYFYLNLD